MIYALCSFVSHVLLLGIGPVAEARVLEVGRIVQLLHSLQLASLGRVKLVLVKDDRVGRLVHLCANKHILVIGYVVELALGEQVDRDAVLLAKLLDAVVDALAALLVVLDTENDAREELRLAQKVIVLGRELVGVHKDLLSPTLPHQRKVVNLGDKEVRVGALRRIPAVVGRRKALEHLLVDKDRVVGRDLLDKDVALVIVAKHHLLADVVLLHQLVKSLLRRKAHEVVQRGKDRLVIQCC